MDETKKLTLRLLCSLVILALIEMWLEAKRRAKNTKRVLGKIKSWFHD